MTFEMAKRLAVAASFGRWLVAGFALTVLLAAALPSLAGMQGYTVRTGSMQPAVDPGDVLVTARVSPAEAEVGDIATFSDPEGSGALITHRVRSVSREGDSLSFVTRGDANNAVERWSIEAGGSIGLVRYRIPMLGHLIARSDGGIGRLLLIVLPSLGLCALGLTRIWAPRRLGAAEAR